MTHIIDLQLPWQQVAKQVLMIKKHAMKSHKRLYRISVIFMAKGDAPDILESLYSIIKQDLVREIVIVNCSPSPQLEEKLYELARLHSRVFILSGYPNMSIAKAYNLGIRHSTSKFLILMSAPYQLPNKIVTKLMQLDVAKSHPWIAGVPQNQYKQFDAILKLQKNTVYKPSPESSSTELDQVISVIPDCVLISQQTIREVGPFDKRCDDTNVLLDMCLRIHSAGGEVYRHAALPPQLAQSKPKFWQLSVKGLNHSWLSWHYFYQKHFGQLYKKRHAFFLYLKLLFKR